jgi:hypothetical protein
MAGLVSVLSRLTHPLPEVPLNERSPAGSHPGIFARYRQRYGAGKCNFARLVGSVQADLEERAEGMLVGAG